MIESLPRGACDCHCHVFGPAARFPYAVPRSYTPDDAPFEAYIAHLDRLGCDAVFWCSRAPMAATMPPMLDALARAPHACAVWRWAARS